VIKIIFLKNSYFLKLPDWECAVQSPHTFTGSSQESSLTFDDDDGLNDLIVTFVPNGSRANIPHTGAPFLSIANIIY
jgi:hypothetical protein